MKPRTAIIIVLVVAAFGAGVYFRDDVVKFFQGLNKQVKDFQNTDIGQTISQVGKQIFTPPPLNIGGLAKPVVLLHSKIIEETNFQRMLNESYPLSVLKENTKLDQVASAKANDMFVKQYFEHVSPSGVGPGDLAQRYGYDYIVEGENLILGNFSSEKEIVQDWMNSPGHRANILNKRYTEIGVAIIKGTYKGQTVWIGVQEFGLPLSACPAPSTVLKNQIDSARTQLDVLASQINDKKNQLDSTNRNSPIYGQMVDDYNQLVEQYNLSAQTLKNIISQYNNQINAFNSCVGGT